MFIQFRPTVDSNLAGIANFTQDVQWVVDPVNKNVTGPSLSGLPLNLQHLLLSILANLANIYTHRLRLW